MVDYGTDLKMDFDEADIVIDASNDIPKIDGTDNLLQAIKTRLLTKQGTLATHVNFGSRLYELIGMTFDDVTLNAAGSFIHQALSEEPRIDEINSLSVDYRQINESPTLVIFLTVTPIDSDVPLNLVVNFEV
jgi:phage baseplate assembly protein W